MPDEEFRVEATTESRSNATKTCRTPGQFQRFSSRLSQSPFRFRNSPGTCGNNFADNFPIDLSFIINEKCQQKLNLISKIHPIIIFPQQNSLIRFSENSIFCDFLRGPGIYLTGFRGPWLQCRRKYSQKRTIFWVFNPSLPREPHSFPSDIAVPFPAFDWFGSLCCECTLTSRKILLFFDYDPSFDSCLWGSLIFKIFPAFRLHLGGLPSPAGWVPTSISGMSRRERKPTCHSGIGGTEGSKILKKTQISLRILSEPGKNRHFRPINRLLRQDFLFCSSRHVP